MGYKKHTVSGFVLVEGRRCPMPLLSLVRAASKADVEMLKPLLNFVRRQLSDRLAVNFVVGDKGYLSASRRRFLSRHWRWVLIVEPKSDMKPPAGTQKDGCPTCPMGERLTWLDYDWEEETLLYCCESQRCERCQLAGSLCSRQFEYPAGTHETYWGAVPSHSRLSQQLRRHFRPRVEPGFYIAKRRHGLGRLFLNSRNLAQQLCQVSDSIELLTILAREGAQKPRRTQNSIKTDVSQPELWDVF